MKISRPVLPCFITLVGYAMHLFATLINGNPRYQLLPRHVAALASLEAAQQASLLFAAAGLAIATTFSGFLILGPRCSSVAACSRRFPFTFTSSSADTTPAGSPPHIMICDFAIFLP